MQESLFEKNKDSCCLLDGNHCLNKKIVSDIFSYTQKCETKNVRTMRLKNVLVVQN